MKQLLKFLFGAAMVLLVGLNFVACSDENLIDEKVVDNPLFNRETNEVTAQFSFNISTTNAAGTRMGVADTQGEDITNEGFRGMNNVYLLTYHTAATADAQNKIVAVPSGLLNATYGGGAHLVTPGTATRRYDLSSLLSVNEINTSHTRRVVELSLPVETNTLLFYGKAPKTKSSEYQGSLSTWNIAEDASQTTITSELRLNSTNTDKFNDTALLISLVLTRIARVGLADETTDGGNKQTRQLHYDFWWVGGDLGVATDKPWLTYTETAGQPKTEWTYNYLTYDEINDRWAYGDAYYDVQHNPEWNESTDILNHNAAIGKFKESIRVSNESSTKTFYHYVGSRRWVDYGNEYRADSHSLSSLGEILGEAYNLFARQRVIGTGDNQTTELRAGSGSAVLRQIADLWEMTSKVENAVPSNPEEVVAVKVAKRLRIRYNAYFKRDPSTGEVSWRNLDDPAGQANRESLKDSLATFAYGITRADFDDAIAPISFPWALNLPMGAAIVSINDTGDNNAIYGSTFYYNTHLPYYGMTGNSSSTTTIDKYQYPPELCYFGNSPIRVSNDTHEIAHYPWTTALWIDDTYWNGTIQNVFSTQAEIDAVKGETGWVKDGKVRSSTRSVAMQETINYGTALLKATVRYGAGTLLDNNFAINGDEDNELPVNGDGTKFRWTGVIIGGQPHSVGWNYIAKSNDFTYMTFEKAMAGTLVDITTNGNAISYALTGGIPIPKYTGAATTDASEPNYTLTWDNYDSSISGNNATQSPVYIALEFFNDYKDFWGNANLVRKGGTFYIIGKIDPSVSYVAAANGDPEVGGVSNTLNLTRADNYALPPYDPESGATIQAPRVFIQDYVTNVDFIIGAESLKHAYITVPDLRSSQISLGLSVDVHWETGLDFRSIVLGE